MGKTTDHPAGTYPRPLLVRKQYVALDVSCGFAYDDNDRGRKEHWEIDAGAFDRRIQLPFAPESPASGVGETGFHPVVWYRIVVNAATLESAGFNVQGDRMILHFGAVDFAADVWVDGQHVASHKGGQTAFNADITNALDLGNAEHAIVVRAFDDPRDVTIPRGKQDWMPEPHHIWYHRTTGIWRTVWIEALPGLHITNIAWTPDLHAAKVRAQIELSARPSDPVTVRAILEFEGTQLADVAVTMVGDQALFDITIEALRNSHSHLVWSPESPRLIDAMISLERSDGFQLDVIDSYLGLRSAGVGQGHFLLNDRPYYVRSVLEQGYWPDSHFTPPSLDALREEVELILSLGFNAARIHQKVEDPRFIYWCDRLGLLIWAETASAYEFSPRAVECLTTEWMQIVRQYRSHPSIVTWVPFNESWGIADGAHYTEERAFSLALTNLTRSLDPSRPVISNDGWEHTDSDIWSIHDYEGSGEILQKRYGSASSVAALIAGMGPSGKIMRTTSEQDRGQPVMLTEFGGVSYTANTPYENSWGYSSVSDEKAFKSRFTAIVEAVRLASELRGFCYTQLTDTRQETNGICDENRVPKMRVDEVRAVVTGGM